MTTSVELNRTLVTWAGVGVVLALALAVTAFAFTGTLLFGLFVYYATRPVYDRIYPRIGNRALAAAVSLLTLAFPIIVLLSYTVLVGLQEFDRFARNNDLSQYREFLAPYVEDLPEVTNIQDLLTDPQALLSDPSFRGIAETVFSEAIGYLGFLGTAALHLFVTIIIAYYLLKDGRRLSRWTLDKLGDDRGTMAAYFRAVDRDFQNVFFGNILNAFLTAVLAAVVYSLLNAYVAPGSVRIPYPVLAGLLMAVGSLIPVVGILVVYVPVGVYLGVTAYAADPALLWFPVLFLIVSFVVIGALPDFVLRPYVAAGSLHMGAVMLAYTFGPLLFGWYGIFLGPVLLVLITHFARIVLPELLSEHTLRPFSVDPTYMEPPDSGAPAGPSVAVDGGDPAGDGTRRPGADEDAPPMSSAPTDDGDTGRDTGDDSTAEDDHPDAGEESPPESVTPGGDPPTGDDSAEGGPRDPDGDSSPPP